MHIAINCHSFLRKQYTGIGRYAYNLVHSLGQIDNKNTYSLYARQSLFSSKKKLPAFFYKNFLRKYDYFNQGVSSILKGVDIYHAPAPEVLEAPKGSRVIVTVHDLIYKAYPQGHTQDALLRSEAHFQSIIKEADKIICCSQSTLNDLKKYFPINDSRLAMVYQGVNKYLFYPIDSLESKKAQKNLKKKGVEGQYLLFVGTIEPRKNLVSVLKALEILKKQFRFTGKLVVVGMKGWMSEDIDERISKYGLTNDVIQLGYLTNDELRYVYNGASLFMFPSFYEGFGFPIVEAFSCGVPVLTSNVSACYEVAKDAALIVNPYDSDEMARKAYSVLSTKELAKDLRAKGLKRAEDFSFARTAKETLNVYKSVVDVD